MKKIVKTNCKFFLFILFNKIVRKLLPEHLEYPAGSWRALR